MAAVIHRLTRASYAAPGNKVPGDYECVSARSERFLHAPVNCCSLFTPPNILWLPGFGVKRLPSRYSHVKSLSNYRKIIEFGALLLLAAVIIWLFGRKLDWHQVKTSVQKSDWRLILIAIVIILLAYLWRVVRWQALLRPLTPTSLREVWIATCVGFAAVLTIGRAGEVVRPLALPMRDRRVRPAAAFVTILIERLYDTMTVVLMFAVNLLWFTPTSSAVEFGWVRIIGFGFLAVLAVGIAL